MGKGDADRTRKWEAYRSICSRIYGIRRQKPLVCICGKSGVGKTTALANTTTKAVISYTTRAPRAGERDGVDYHFRSKEWFQRNKSLFTYDLKEFSGEIYGAADEDLEACDAMVIRLEDAIALKRKGLKTKIIWMAGPIRAQRGIREDIDKEQGQELLEHVDHTVYNVGDLADTVAKLEKLL